MAEPSSGDDVLSWLLPDVPEEERARLRRAVLALRLLRDAARPRAAPGAAASWASARAALERLERGRRLRALEALLRSHLDAALGPDSFLELGPPGASTDLREAWRVLLAGELPAGLPAAPGRAPLDVADALLAAASAAGASRDWQELWSARRDHAARGAAQAERRWVAALRASPPASLRRARLLAGLLAARLEGFAPAGALALARGHAALVPLDPGLRRLAGWSALLCGELGAARSWLTPEVRESAPSLPRALVELGEVWPESRALLAGRARGGAEGELGRTAGRQAVGALVLALFVLRAGGARETLVLDAAPSVRAAAGRWLAERDGAWRRPGEPEELLLASGVPQRFHRSGTEPVLRGALGGGRTLALARTPLLGLDGRAGGWVHLESEHHLLPADSLLRSLARAWSARGEVRETTVRVAETGAPCALRRAGFAADDPRLEAWRALLRALGRRGARRSASWLEAHGDGFLVRAESGGPARDELAPGGGLLGRALAARAPVLQAALERLAGVHASAGSCLVVPLLAGAGTALGFLVIESPRAGDLGRDELARSTGALAGVAPRWWASSFRVWHRARYDIDVAWDAGARTLVALEPAVRAASASRACLFLQGAVGAGRRTLARWVHFRAEGWAPAGECDDPLRAALHELAFLDRERQLALARELEDGRRQFLLVEAPPHLLRERGALVRELERRVDPLPLHVPPLADRRDEIPGLLAVLARDVARRETLACPWLAEGAVALLWRQDWRGNVSELASIVAQLVRAHPGAEVGAAQVDAALRSRGLVPCERLPSLRPRELDLVAALRATRHASGSWNRARAARYLGWDADTLEQRLRERGLDEAEGAPVAGAPP